MPSYTKKAIMDSFIRILSEKPLDKISVKDIIEDCELNRSTFYYYYEDIYSLLEDLFKTEVDKITKKHQVYTSWQSGFIESADFVLKNKKAVYHIYNSIGRDHLEDFLYKVTSDLMINFVRKEAEGMPVSEKDIEFIASFFEYALVGFVLKWIQNGMKDDPRESVDRLAKIFDGSIKRALENCNDSCSSSIK